MSTRIALHGGGMMGGAILAVSALSFLGYGVPRPAAEWGGLISDGRSYLAVAPWLTALPGLVIAATVLALQQVATSPAPAADRPPVRSPP